MIVLTFVFLFLQGQCHTVTPGETPMVLQAKGTLTLQVGDTLTLPCVVSSLTPVGPVKWMLVTPEKRQTLVWDFRTHGSSRVAHMSDTTQPDNRDFSIIISDIILSDAGTYYCVKFKKALPEDIEISRGEGIQVVVAKYQEPTHLPDGWDWSTNSLVTMSQAVATGGNLSNCWVCHYLPRSGASLSPMAAPVFDYSKVIPDCTLSYYAPRAPVRARLIQYPFTVPCFFLANVYNDTSGTRWEMKSQIPRAKAAQQVFRDFQLLSSCDESLTVSLLTDINASIPYGPNEGLSLCAPPGYTFLCGGKPYPTSEVPVPRPSPYTWAIQCLTGVHFVGQCTLGFLTFPTQVYSSLFQDTTTVLQRKRDVFLPAPKSREVTGIEKNPVPGENGFGWWFLRTVMSGLGMNPMEMAIRNLSDTIHLLGIEKALRAQKTSLSSLVGVVLDNRIALDFLLAESGGVCAVVNKTCCAWINASGKVEVGLDIMDKVTKQADPQPSQGNDWEQFTNLFPDLASWLVPVIILGVMITITCVCVRYFIKLIAEDTASTLGAEEGLSLVDLTTPSPDAVDRNHVMQEAVTEFHFSEPPPAYTP